MKKTFKFILIAGLSLSLVGGLAVVGFVTYLSGNLPEVSILHSNPLQVPLKIFTKDGELIAEYGSQRRSPVTFEALPQGLIDAIVATEDQRFFEHNGVDLFGLMRAALYIISTGHRGQGGSTITMQVARNFFLTPERTYIRKVREILLALKIERELTKEDILTLYFNKIFLGNRAYGVAAAAQVYYGKSISELNLPQLAMLAGLPKAPSKINPLANPIAAKRRRNFVLSRMLYHGFIDDRTFRDALQAPITAKYHGLPVEVEAPYIAEMVRDHMVSTYGREKAYTSGYKVYTTIDTKLQAAANQALRTALIDYDIRHGYRGPYKTLELHHDADPNDWLEVLNDIPQYGGLTPVLVLHVLKQSAHILLPDGQAKVLPWKAMQWARPYINDNRRGPAPKLAQDVVSRGDIVWVKAIGSDTPMLVSIPAVNGALVSLDAHTGGVLALTGGFDFYASKYNRAVQAKRQPGSNFKPFIYSAALEHGYTAASLINDAPVVFEDVSLEGTWRPENYSGKFFGPTRLRSALINSRNLVSIRILRQIGIPSAIEHAQKFGFAADALPANLSLALGSGVVSPLELAGGYAVFANGGYRKEPFFIDQIEDAMGFVLFSAQEKKGDSLEVQSPSTIDEVLEQEQAVDPDAPILSPENAYIMNSLMQDVIQHGTGKRARLLGRKDIAGKTGTTNDQTDAWFTGFNGDIVATAWVGFDRPRPLGNREVGGRAALPMWIDYMKIALAGKPESTMARPANIVSVRIDPNTGLLARANDSKAMFEIFRKDHVPREIAEKKTTSTNSEAKLQAIPEALF